MKTIRLSFASLFSGVFKTVGWTAFWAGVWLIFCAPDRLPVLRDRGLLAIGGIGALCLLRSLSGAMRCRRPYGWATTRSRAPRTSDTSAWPGSWTGWSAASTLLRRRNAASPPGTTWVSTASSCPMG